MPSPIQWQPSPPQAVHSQVIYQPESQNQGFLADIGQAFGLAKGIHGMFQEDPAMRQAKDQSLAAWMDRYDNADSPEAKSAVIKQGLAYADKTGNDELRAIFEASDPKILSQKQEANKRVVDRAKIVDERGQSGFYAGDSSAQDGNVAGGATTPPPEAVQNTGGAAAPAASAPAAAPDAAPPSTWGGDPVESMPSWMSGDQVVNSGTDTELGTTRVGPGEDPKADFSQGMVSGGSDAEPMYHPLQIEVAGVAGVSPDDVMLEKTDAGLYPTVKISAIALNPKLPLDAILKPPPPGPEDKAIEEVRRTKTVPASQQWARDMSSLRMWQKIATGQVPDASDMLGFAVSNAQAEMIIRDAGAAAGIISPEASDLGNIMMLASVFRGKFDPSDPKATMTQQWYSKLSPQEQKVAISVASAIAQGSLSDDQLKLSVDTLEQQKVYQAAQVQQGQQELAIREKSLKFDSRKWEEQKSLSMMEMLSRETMAAADRGLKVQDMDLKEREYEQRERFKAMEQDDNAMQRLTQVVSLLGEGDEKAKSYITIAESFRSSVDSIQRAIDSNDILINRYELGQEPMKDITGEVVAPGSPKYSEVLRAEVNRLKTESERLRKRQREAMEKQEEYTTYATKALSNSSNPRAQQAMGLLTGTKVDPVTGKLSQGPNIGQSTYRPPSTAQQQDLRNVDQLPAGMDEATFARQAMSQGIPKQQAQQLWKKYLVRTKGKKVK